MTKRAVRVRSGAVAGVAAMGAALMMAAVGCGAATPQRLDEQVALFLDDLRWGRMTAADGVVGSRYRERYLRAHNRWSERVHIMDVEMETGRIGLTQGTMRVRYQWTGPDGVNMRDTVVESTWRAGPAASWYLDDERVIAGDPSLLPMPRERPAAVLTAGTAPAAASGAAPASSGGSAPAASGAPSLTPAGPAENDAPPAAPASAPRAQAGAHAP